MSSVMPALILIFLFSISLDELSIVIFSSLLFSFFSRLQISVGSLLKTNLEGLSPNKVSNIIPVLNSLKLLSFSISQLYCFLLQKMYKNKL